MARLLSFLLRVSKVEPVRRAAKRSLRSAGTPFLMGAGIFAFFLTANIVMTIVIFMAKSVSKNVLKAKMLEYFRAVEKTGEPLIVTSHGKPTLKVIPIKSGKSVSEVFGKFQGKIKYNADILESTTSEWTDL